MPQYEIPIDWTMQANVVVEANTIEEAINKVMEDDIPTKGDYLEDSIRLQVSDLYNANRMELSTEIEIAINNIRSNGKEWWLQE